MGERKKKKRTNSNLHHPSTGGASCCLCPLHLSSCHLLKRLNRKICVKLVVLKGWNSESIGAVLSPTDRWLPRDQAGLRSGMRWKELVMCCHSRTLATSPYQAVQRSTLVFEESTENLAEEQETPSFPFWRLSFQTVLHNGFAVPEQGSQCGVYSLLYGLAHVSQAAKPG